MGNDSRLSARFGSDTSDFKQGVTEINRELRLIESGFKATASTMADWSNTSKGLEARIGALTKEIILQGEKTDALRERALQLAKAHGENSVEAKNAAIEYNKEAEKLGKLQTELGQTERGLKGMESTSKGVRGAFKNLGTQFDNLKQQVPAVGSAFALLTNPITLAVAGLTAFVAISKKSITEVVAYNRMIREMGQVTGLSADEISRIVQVGDDWGISAEALSTSLEFMNKKGVTPSIDAIAKMADEYVAATDKSKWAEEAVKTLGKGYTTLIPLLALGGDGFRKAAAGIDKNLIATEKGIEASREFEVAMDDLNDTAQGLKYTLGNELVPPLVKVAQSFNDMITDNQRVTRVMSAYKAMIKAGVVTQESFNDALKMTGTTADGTERGFATLETAVNNYFDSLTMGYPEEERFIQLFKDLTGQTVIVAEETDIYTEALDNLNLMLSDPLAREMEDFILQQKDLATKMKDVQDQIDILNGMELLTEDQKKELETLQGEYTTLKGQYEENAKVHRQKTREIIIDLAIQSVAASGLSEDIKAKLLGQIANVATQWGLTDAASLTALANMGTYLTGQEPTLVGFGAIIYDIGRKFGVWGENIDYANTKASDLALKIDQLDGRTANIYVHITQDPWSPPGVGQGPQGGQAGGAGYVVPPGYDNDNWPLGTAQSGEGVIIIPRNKMLGNSLANMKQLFNQSAMGLSGKPGMLGGGGMVGGAVSNQWNYTIQAANPLQTAGDLVRQVRLLELMHR